MIQNCGEALLAIALDTAEAEGNEQRVVEGDGARAVVRAEGDAAEHARLPGCDGTTSHRGALPVLRPFALAAECMR
jgi:hypothetical protein